MKDADKLRISHSENALNIYFPKEIGQKLDRSFTYSVAAIQNQDGSVRFAIVRGKGRNRINYTERDHLPRPYRLVERTFLRWNGSMPRNQLPKFGLVDVVWELPFDNTDPNVALFFTLPKQEELPAPGKRRARRAAPPVNSRQLALPLKASVEETPHEKLGRLLKELNALFESGDVEDVDMEIVHSEAGSPSVYRVPCRPSKMQIKGKIIREEILG